MNILGHVFVVCMICVVFAILIGYIASYDFKAETAKREEK
jgi:hypothetical protein